MKTRPVRVRGRRLSQQPQRLDNESVSSGAENAPPGALLTATSAVAEDDVARRFASLQQTEERFALTAAGARDGLWDWHIATGEHCISPRGKAILGYQDDEIPSGIDEWIRRVHPDDAEQLIANFTAHWNRLAACFEAEHRVLHKDGTYRWALVHGLLLRDASGTPVRMAGSYADISDRRRTEQALRHRLDFERLLGRISTQFISLSTADTVKAINDALRAIGEFMNADRCYIMSFAPIGTMGLEYEWCGEGVPGLLEEFQDVPVDLYPWWLERRQRFDIIHVPRVADLPADGAARELLVSKGARSGVEVPMVSGGALIACLGLSSSTERMWTDDDVTLLKLAGELFMSALQRQRAEQARVILEERLQLAQRLDAVGRLASSIAHDFNNQLTIIKGCAQFLLAGLPLDDSLRADAARINSTVDRGAHLLRQLLAFGSKQPSEPQPLDLNKLVQEMAPMLRLLLGEQVSLHVKTAPDLWRVRADPIQIERVIMNVVANAKDAMPAPGDGTPAGSVTLETANVGCEAAGADLPHHPHGYALVSVSDTGDGMIPEVQRHIFEPYFTTKPFGKGTGLGLSTAFGLVKQHGGLISCTSQPGRGTTFKIHLPCESREALSLRQRDPNPLALVDSLPGASVPLRPAATVLVVEDEQPVQELIREVLEDAGYRVHVAGGVDEALDLASTIHPPLSLLVSDIALASGSGYALARRLSLVHPGLRILFMSGYPDTWFDSIEVVPGSRFLQKPFSFDVLLQQVRDLLAQ